MNKLLGQVAFEEYTREFYPENLEHDAECSDSCDRWMWERFSIKHKIKWEHIAQKVARAYQERLNEVASRTPPYEPTKGPIPEVGTVAYVVDNAFEKRLAELEKKVQDIRGDTKPVINNYYMAPPTVIG